MLQRCSSAVAVTLRSWRQHTPAKMSCIGVFSGGLSKLHEGTSSRFALPLVKNAVPFSRTGCTSRHDWTLAPSCLTSIMYVSHSKLLVMSFSVLGAGLLKNFGARSSLVRLIIVTTLVVFCSCFLFTKESKAVPRCSCFSEGMEIAKYRLKGMSLTSVDQWLFTMVMGVPVWKQLWAGQGPCGR